MNRLPYGALYNHRRRGTYGNYITWKMLKVMAVLAKPDPADTPPTTARYVAKKAGISYVRTLDILKRLQKRDWVKQHKQMPGKPWTLLNEGYKALLKILGDRLRVKLQWSDLITEKVMETVEQASRALEALKEFGICDTLARELLIRFPLYKILWAIRTTRARLPVRNRAGYVITLLKHGHQEIKRCEKYISMIANNLGDEAKETLVRQALMTVDPFTAVVKVVNQVHFRDKSYQMLNQEDMLRLFDEMYVARKLPKCKGPAYT